MKWTSDNDQMLFMKLLETHDVSVRGEKIREAWPKDGREIPSARAITERIIKIRNSVKAKAEGDSVSPKKRKGSDTDPFSPSKNTTDYDSSSSPTKRSKATPRGRKVKKEVVHEDFGSNPYAFTGMETPMYDTSGLHQPIWHQQTSGFQA